MLPNQVTILFYTKSKKYTFNLQRGEVTQQMKAKYCHEDADGKYMMSYGKKYYLKGGKAIDDVWDNDIWNIPTLSPSDRERTGYPTQKPEALLERIISASSNKNDTIFDPFCGCGTSAAVARKLDRSFIGIDINKEAVELSRNRLMKYDK